MKVYGYGDSIMWGWDPRIGVPNNRLPEEVIWFERLSSVYGFEVINDSLPGRKIPGKRIVKQLISSLEAQDWDVLFLMLGANDVLDNKYLPMMKIGQKWDAALAALLERFPDKRNRIVLATCHYSPIYGFYDIPDKIRRGYQIMAEKYGIPFYDALEELPTLYDKLHLSEQGHVILASHVAAYLKGKFGKE